MTHRKLSNMELLNAALKPKVQTGVCAHCGRPIYNKRADAKFCSPACRTAACRVRCPATKPLEEIKALQTELAKSRAVAEMLRSELATLQARYGGEPSTAGPMHGDLKAAAVRTADKYIKRPAQRN